MTRRRQPKKMSVGSLLSHSNEKVRHALSQVPTVKGTRVDDNEAILQRQFIPASRSLVLTKAEQFQIGTTGHDFMGHFTISQAVPFLHQGPDSFRQGHDGVGGSER